MAARFTIRRLIQLLVGLIVVIVIGFFLTPGIDSEKVLVNDQSQWLVRETFGIDGEFPPEDKAIRTKLISKHPDLKLWGSWMGSDDYIGRLASPPFEAPPILSMYVSGHPTKVGNRLFMRRLDTKETLELRVNDPGLSWIQAKWLIPPSWWGTQVRIVAIDRSNGPGGWLGISSPLSVSWINIIQPQLPSALLFLVYVMHLLLFLIPGILITIWWKLRYSISNFFSVILSVTFSSLIGYITFWIYWINHDIGNAFSIVLMLASIITLTFTYARNKATLTEFISSKDVRLPIMLMLVVGVFYLSILFVIESHYPPENWVQWRFLFMPPDNVIPKIFADKLYEGADLRPPMLGDWLSSDRPPLQTGIILLQYPIMFWSGFSYQILATIAQCAWIPAIWALCRTINLSGRQIAIVIAFCIFSGFFFFNSLFVWPKLLSGALVIFSFVLLLQPILAAKPISSINMGLVALSTSLGLLAHSGVIFALPAMLPMFFQPKNFSKLRRLLLVGCAVFFVLIAPWSAYQKLFNPPGNRLVKWHLSGVMEVDERSSSQAILDSYTSVSAKQILNNKLENAKSLFNPNIRFSSPEQMRNNNFFCVFNSLGILNFGWLIFIRNILTQSSQKGRQNRSITLILSTSIVNLVVWVLVMFGPAATVIHQGSYAVMMLLFAGLTSLVATLPNWFVCVLMLIHIVFLGIIWIFTGPLNPPDAINAIMPNFFMLSMALFSLITLIVLLTKIAKEGKLSEGNELELNTPML